jgi:hypothetical protein
MSIDLEAEEFRDEASRLRGVVAENEGLVLHGVHSPEGYGQEAEPCDAEASTVLLRRPRPISDPALYVLLTLGALVFAMLVIMVVFAIFSPSAPPPPP